jgi:hypothetical protein
VQASVAPTPTVRSRELARVEELLALRRPSVVTISGLPGIGKSTLLGAIAERARDAGWYVVGPVTVTGETTIRELLSAVETLEPSAATQTADESARAAGGATDEPAPGSTAASQFVPPVERIAAALEDPPMPVVLLFDGYRPVPDVDEQLAAIFERVRSRQSSTIAVLADREPGLTALGAPAELPLTLGPFDETELRAYLEEATASVEPPLSAAELDSYVADVRSRPDLVDSLTRLFAFLATGTPSKPEPA